MSQEPTSKELIRELPVASTLTAPFVIFDVLVEGAVTRTGENLATYYQTVLDHTQKSFETSRIVAIAGFVLILFGMAAAMFFPERGTSVPVLSGAAGVATEFISAIFFYLYNRTVSQMKEYHQSLLMVQNILLALKLVGDTTDPDRKAKMLETLLQFLVGPPRVWEETSSKPPTTKTKKNGVVS